jgi:hypothetical protein
MRIRSIKPEFWTNEKMARRSEFARLLAIALLNLADDEGYFWANPILIRGAVFPFLEDSERIRGALVELSIDGYLRLGVDSEGREIGKIVRFLDHQKIDKPSTSRIKELAIFGEASANTPRSLGEDSPLDQGSGIRDQGSRNVRFARACEGSEMPQVESEEGDRPELPPANTNAATGKHPLSADLLEQGRAVLGLAPDAILLEWRRRGWPDDWQSKALALTSARTGRGPPASYAEAILRRWQAQGGPDPEPAPTARAGQKGRGRGRGEGAMPHYDADYVDPVDHTGEKLD